MYNILMLILVSATYGMTSPMICSVQSLQNNLFLDVSNPMIQNLGILLQLLFLAYHRRENHEDEH